ncbi:MAG: glycosyltransferase family 4 protein, partial [Elusimicrobiota bacterium]|nr:glycosyltransferase family 4 protein [Endomicrobiia bacterium]MDW8166654.1 glycosyltransferase family 4 protein [Elusimicrobiota bacterium]
CKTLAKAGYEVYLIAPHEKEEEVDNVKIVPISPVKNRIKRILFQPFRALKLALRVKARVYHIHDPELILVGVFIKFLSHGKVIYDVHENVKGQIIDKEWIPFGLHKVVLFLYSIIESLCLRFLDFIIIAEDSYKKLYPNNNRVLSIRNFPILNYLNEMDNLLTQDCVNKDIDVIYVGGISIIRGIFELLNVANILRDLNFVFIGSISDTLLDKITNFVNMFQLVNVKFLGEVSHRNVYRLICKAKIGVAILHPRANYIESLPTKLFEYMSVGLPVVASNFPLWKDIVEGNECGICVDPLNPKEIANAIKYILDHPDEARKMGENGRKAVLEKYNWEKESEKLLLIYSSLLRY